MIIALISIAYGYDLRVGYQSYQDFNMSEGCEGEIAFAPDNDDNFVVCLQNGSGVTLTGSCRTYTSGVLGSGDMITTGLFDFGLLEDGKLYRFSFDWERINYVDMNISTLNGKNDTGGTASCPNYDICGNSTKQSRIYSDNACGSQISAITDLWGIYVSNDCSGSPYVYQEATKSDSSTYRVTEAYTQANYNGTDVTVSNCLGVITESTCTDTATLSSTRVSGAGGACTDRSGTPVEAMDYYVGFGAGYFDMCQTCSAGTTCTWELGLCTYAGDYTVYSDYFIFNSTIKGTATNFTSNLTSYGNVTWFPSIDNCSSYTIPVINWTFYRSSNIITDGDQKNVFNCTWGNWSVDYTETRYNVNSTQYCIDVNDMNLSCDVKTFYVTDWTQGWIYSQNYDNTMLDNITDYYNLTIPKLYINFSSSTDIQLMTGNQTMFFESASVLIAQTNISVGKVSVAFNNGTQFYEYYNDENTYIDVDLKVI